MGRTLPQLLFATDVAKLRSKLGSEVDAVLAMATDAGHTLHDVSGVKAPWSNVAAAAPGKAGVVVLGDYDVMPSQRLDCIPAAVRKALTGKTDPDDWTVWNDHAYGDVDQDQIPDLPVSRIPDGGSIELLRHALSAGLNSSSAGRFGLRNAARPFADEVFKEVSGAEAMLLSEPTTTADVKPAQLATSSIYLMLHGNAADCSRYWGEKPCGSGLEALTTKSIPELDGSVVFAGCCYGALVAKEAAITPGGPTPLALGQSIALEFLNKGAVGFVGATGAHYSPAGSDLWGSPTLHIEFWKHVAAGCGPAEALFRAKIDYLTNLPYCPDPQVFSILLKPWGQFTCLGLGW